MATLTHQRTRSNTCTNATKRSGKMSSLTADDDTKVSCWCNTYLLRSTELILEFGGWAKREILCKRCVCVDAGEKREWTRSLGLHPKSFFFSQKIRWTWTRTQWTCPWPRPVANACKIFFRARARVHCGSKTSHEFSKKFFSHAKWQS
jgi:hypothetical protein